MATIDGRASLEHISAPTCWELRESTPLGRLNVLDDSAPEIYPGTELRTAARA
jgi:hypothetical protein